jgi:hypothetical protein
MWIFVVDPVNLKICHVDMLLVYPYPPLIVIEYRISLFLYYLSVFVARCYKEHVEECLYYCDISPINVFITTELLKCHVEMNCGKRLNIKYNSWVGDTLELNPEKEWKVKGFHAVIGNPPYQQVSIKGKSKGGGIMEFFFLLHHLPFLVQEEVVIGMR